MKRKEKMKERKKEKFQSLITCIRVFLNTFYPVCLLVMLILSKVRVFSCRLWLINLFFLGVLGGKKMKEIQFKTCLYSCILYIRKIL
jgi:hypothetical protein